MVTAARTISMLRSNRWTRTTMVAATTNGVTPIRKTPIINGTLTMKTRTMTVTTLSMRSGSSSKTISLMNSRCTMRSSGSVSASTIQYLDRLSGTPVMELVGPAYKVIGEASRNGDFYELSSAVLIAARLQRVDSAISQAHREPSFV